VREKGIFFQEEYKPEKKNEFRDESYKTRGKSANGEGGPEKN